MYMLYRNKDIILFDVESTTTTTTNSLKGEKKDNNDENYLYMKSKNQNGTDYHLVQAQETQCVQD